MTNGNENDGEPTLFCAVLTPHRSLSATGFVVLMVAVGAVSFVAGMVFLLMGAWPVFGFFGLDVALIYLAFRINYRRAAAYEEFRMTPSLLRVRKVGHRGDVAEWTFNPRWVRLDATRHEEFGLERLALVSHGRRLGIAHFLGPDEKDSFASALARALGAARRGHDHNPAA